MHVGRFLEVPISCFRTIVGVFDSLGHIYPLKEFLDVGGVVCGVEVPACLLGALFFVGDSLSPF